MDELRQTLLARGASLVGFADLRPLPPDVRGDLPFGVSMAVALFCDVVEKIADGPTEQYLTEYAAIQRELPQNTPTEPRVDILENLAECLTNIALAWKVASQKQRNRLASCLFETVWIKDKKV